MATSSSSSRLAFLALTITCLGTVVQASLLNNLSTTPAMGWNTWNVFGCDISADIIIDNAKELKKLGLDKLGYNYINLDDCWQGERDDNGVISADSEKFPDGIKAVADQIHDMGLKIGIYSDAGLLTCGKHLGSLGFEEQDAKSYADWGIDYLKYDNCHNNGSSGTSKLTQERYYTMALALNKTGRPILYSLCNWGEDGPWNWGWTMANSWRMSGDIYDRFDGYDDRCPCETADCWLAGYHCSMMNIVNKVAPVGQKAGPGGWNDMDLLEVGNGGMTKTEYQTHFSMWAINKSPLILSLNLSEATQDDLSIIKNKHIIDVNQDESGSAAIRIWKKEDGTQLWFGYLVNSTYVVTLLNSSPEDKKVTAKFTDIFQDLGKEYAGLTFSVYDLWKNATHIGDYSNSITAQIPSHGVKVYKFKEANPKAGEKIRNKLQKRLNVQRGGGRYGTEL